MSAVTFIQVSGQDESVCDWDFGGDRTEMSAQLSAGRGG